MLIRFTKLKDIQHMIYTNKYPIRYLLRMHILGGTRHHITVVSFAKSGYKVHRHVLLSYYSCLARLQATTKLACTMNLWLPETHPHN